MSEAFSIRWRAPEELVQIGFSRSRVVMMNEAHNGWLRCVRTRTLGTRALPVPHAAGVRHLAMEALFDPDRSRPRTTPATSPTYADRAIWPSPR
jgi:hypothetical protein